MSGLDSDQVAVPRSVNTGDSDLPSSDSGRGEGSSSDAVNQPKVRVRVVKGWFWRIVAVVLQVAAAFLCRQVLSRGNPGLPPFITFYPAVLLAGLLDGVWGGILVTAASTAVAAIWVLAPVGQLSIGDPKDVFGLAIFFLFGIALSVVLEMFHRSREQLAAFQLQAVIANERRRAEDERKLADRMQAERQRLLDVLENLPAMISLISRDHLVTFANRTFRQKFGEPRGLRCYEARFARTTPCESCDTFIPLTTGQPNRREVTFPDGSVMAAHDLPFADLDGSALILEMGIDVTERRRAESELSAYRQHLEDLVRERTRELESAKMQLEKEVRELEITQLSLRESQAKLQAALVSMTDSVIITDAHGQFIDCNEAFATFYRFKSKDECATNFAEITNLVEVSLVSGDPVPTDALAIRRALNGEKATNVEFSYRRRDTGEEWIGSLSFGPIRAGDGSITGSVITARDITARKRAEAALLRTEKLAVQREQLQALAERLDRAREDERTRVSRDLHDQLGQLLTAIKFDLIWIGKRLPKPQQDLRGRLARAIELINDGVRSVRKICSGLRPRVLDDLGLAAAIEWQAGDFASRTGVQCEVSLPSSDLNIDSGQATAFFRIFQECLTNVIRHSEANLVSVSLREEDDDLVMVVEDNGKGFRESETSGSLGFLGMRERANACGGEVQISSAPGRGTAVCVRLPMQVSCSNGNEHAHSHR